MASIKYILVNGIPPITVSITPAVQPDQIRDELGDYFFANLSDGVYTIRATDVTGCWDEITATINCSTTSTTSTSTTCYVGAALNQVACDDWDIGCEGCYEYLLQNISETETARFYIITCAGVPTTVDISPDSQLELCLSACMVYPLDGYGIATRTEDCTPATTTSTTQEPTTTSTSTLEPTTTSTSTTDEVTTTSTSTVEPTTSTTTSTTIAPETDYGFLYNWWAAIGDIDGDNVADTSITSNNDWKIPSVSDIAILQSYIGIEMGGGKLKETGTTYWNSPNTGATNEYYFNGRGAGSRDPESGEFDNLKESSTNWTTTENSINEPNDAADTWGFWFDEEYFGGSGFYGLKNTGLSIRLIKNSTTLTHGQTGTYTGNNGITYPTICIGTQEWLACNLEETKFRDGTDIPYIDNEDSGDDAIWAAATSAAYCIYPIT